LLQRVYTCFYNDLIDLKMKNKRFLSVLVLAPVLTFLLVWSHKFLPVRSYNALREVNEDIHLYADDTAGGNSTAIWIDKGVKSWECRLRQGIEYPFCGLSILVTGSQTHGIDLSSYDKIDIWLSYEGNARKIRLYLRNHDPKSSYGDSVDAAKFNTVKLFTNDLNRKITVDMTEFSVADWWLDRYNVPRKDARPEFFNVVNIGLDFDSVPFGDHRVTVRKLEFRGEWISAESWYLLIISLWVGGVFFFALWRWSHHYKHAARISRRAAELVTYNEQLRSKTDEYAYLSKTDPLTGALNRFGFTKVVEECIANRKEGEPIAMVLFSVDQFKRVKDNAGLKQSDKILQHVATCIAENSRENYPLCRWEGDEFILLCPDTLSSTAYIMAENIRKSIAADQHKQAQRTVTMCCTVAEMLDGEGFADIFKKLDQALYKAKSIGGNCTIMG